MFMLNRVRIKNMFQNDKYTNFNQSVSTYNLNQKTGLLTWNKGFWSSWQKSSDCVLPLSPENFINPILTIFSNVLSGWEVPQRHSAPSCPERTSLDSNSKPSSKWAVLVKQILTSDRGSNLLSIPAVEFF